MIRHVQVSSIYDVVQNSVGYDGPLPADWLYWQNGYWHFIPNAQRFYLPVEERTYEEAQDLYDRWVLDAGKENLVVIFANLGKVLIDEPREPKRWLGTVLMGAIRAEGSLDSFDPGRNDNLPWVGVPSVKD